MSVRNYLIEDIKHLSDHDVNKLYKYVRRYLVAKIEGLVDPLETASNKKYMVTPTASPNGGNMFLITYRTERVMAYDLAADPFEWLIHCNKLDDAPYFILNILPLTKAQAEQIENDGLVGM